MNNRRAYVLSTEVVRLQAKLGDRPTLKERVDRPIAKAWLLDGAFMRNGERWEPVAKSVGLGVFDVSVKPAV